MNTLQNSKFEAKNKISAVVWSAECVEETDFWKLMLNETKY